MSPHHFGVIASRRFMPSIFRGGSLAVLLILAPVLPAQASAADYVSGNHVTVYFAFGLSRSVVRSYLAALDSMCAADINSLKTQMDGKLKARLCRDAYDFEDVTGDDSIFSPLWKDGVLYIKIGGDFSDRDFLSSLDAGVIEAMLDRLRSNGAPRWLIYSAAVFESRQYKGCTPPPIESVSYFQDLDEKIQSASSSTELSDLCFYLGSTGKFFDVEFGPGSLVRLLHEFERFNTIGRAVEGAFHQNYERVERDWHDFLLNASQ